MKHRSVIAYVIVAAALFAAPQLSHDLAALKSAAGARLRGEILHAFLSMPAAEGTAAAAKRPAGVVLASCTKEKSAAPAAKPRKTEADASPRAAARTAADAQEQLALVVETEELSEVWPAALPRPAQPHVEMAMIIPPDSGIDPRSMARVTGAAVRGGALLARAEAGEARASYVATRLEKNAEWRKLGEALRGLEGAQPVGYEFRVDSEGQRTKVVKVRRAACVPCPAPPAPRTPGLSEAGAPTPADGVAAEAASE